ncbi:hypothetical protein [Amaricoccus sp.]|uniref:hypothetical protein n=1 Tax=Amaricoccus sp. TaxID=1872485 RepID=UPI001B693400|nr:hypothetical protein [Amaricoccus sp.]MBP7002497.1 hypothetical protein [Amaricoccus sp.]
MLDALALGVDALSFDPDAFRRVAAPGGPRGTVFALVFVAGMSQATGHAVTLFLNHVRPGRFVLSLALQGAVYVAGALLTVALALALDEMAFGRNLAFLPTAAVVALAHAPRLLGILTLAPYIGEQLDRAIDVWVLLLTLFGLHHGLGLPFAGAAFFAFSGWAAMRLLTVLLGRPVGWLLGGLERVAAGAPLTLNAGGLVDDLRRRARAGRGDGDGEDRDAP